jgi:hypothetical protein
MFPMLLVVSLLQTAPTSFRMLDGKLQSLARRIQQQNDPSFRKVELMPTVSATEMRKLRRGEGRKVIEN